jgi:hypothetical protein
VLCKEVNLFAQGVRRLGGFWGTLGNTGIWEKKKHGKRVCKKVYLFAHPDAESVKNLLKL